MLSRAAKSGVGQAAVRLGASVRACSVVSASWSKEKARCDVTFESGAEASFSNTWLRDNCWWEPTTFQRARDTNALLASPHIVPSHVGVVEGALQVTWPRLLTADGDGLRQSGPPTGPAHTHTAVGAWVEVDEDSGVERGVFGAAFLQQYDALATPASASPPPPPSTPQAASPHQRIWRAGDFASSAVEGTPVLPGVPSTHAAWHSVPSGSGEGVSSVFGSKPEQVREAEHTSLPSVPHTAMGSDAGMFEALASLHIHGFVAVTGVPVTATADLIRSIAPPRPTFYGADGLWRTEVRPDGNDTAYQAIPLPAHTDGTYFQDPPGLQVFHATTAAPSGGSSLLLDGYAVAQSLAQLDPEAYAFFATTPLPCRFLDGKNSVIAWHRVFRLDACGRLEGFAFNSDDRAPLGGYADGASGAVADAFYTHLPSLMTCLRAAPVELWFQLTPGTCLIFDNTRVLHGRSGFSVTHPRVLEGAYLNREDWQSKLRVLGAAAGWDGVSHV